MLIITLLLQHLSISPLTLAVVSTALIPLYFSRDAGAVGSNYPKYLQASLGKALRVQI